MHAPSWLWLGAQLPVSPGTCSHHIMFVYMLPIFPCRMAGLGAVSYTQPEMLQVACSCRSSTAQGAVWQPQWLFGKIWMHRLKKAHDTLHGTSELTTIQTVQPGHSNNLFISQFLVGCPLFFQERRSPQQSAT